jgi:hypothetical protein
MAVDVSQFLAELKAAYPWTEQLGLTAQWFQQTAAEATGPDEILVKIRATPQYKQLFPAIRRTDGSLRMNEAQYLARGQDFRRLLTQHGFDPNEYSSPASLVGFYEAETDPNELRDRLTVWRQIQDSGPRVKDAFYVYAGLSIELDDLFEAAVDPAAGQRLTEAYNASSLPARSTTPRGSPGRPRSGCSVSPRTCRACSPRALSRPRSCRPRSARTRTSLARSWTPCTRAARAR